MKNSSMQVLPRPSRLQSKTPKSGLTQNNRKQGSSASVAPHASATITQSAAVAIGVGAMIGAGIFSILGLIATMVSDTLPLVFLLGAFICSFSMYSYTKLSMRFPSVGGPVQFMVQGFGDTVFAGGLNIFQYLAYVISIAFYANGFAGYAVSIFENPPSWVYKACALGVVALFVAVNLLGAHSMGSTEIVIVGIKVAILLAFGIFGLFFMKSAHWATGFKNFSIVNLLEATALISIGFQGFGLVTNAAGHMRNVKQTLPRVMALVLGITLVIYLLVSITVIGVAPQSMLAHSSSNLLAPVAELFMGKFGYYLLIVAALLSTSSAVNATLFGSANMAYQIARDGELPEQLFEAGASGCGREGIIVTGVLVAALVLFFDLAPIAMMASAAFLAVYTIVNIAHFRIRSQTGAKTWILVGGIVVTGAFFVTLFVYMVKTSEPAAWISFVALAAASFILEALYRRFAHRSLAHIEMH